MVRLTVVNGTPSTATAYSRRSVAPRVKVLPEARNVVVSFVDLPPSARAMPTRVEFAIDDVPVGEHALVAWHERIGERRERVTIRPGATTDVMFTLPVLESAP